MREGNASFDSSGLQFAWDSTSIGYAETCLRKYQLSMIEGWRHKIPSVHLRFGGHYATALEHFHKHLANGLTKDEALIEVVWEMLKATWDYEEISPDEIDQNPEKTQKGKPWTTDHPTKTRENLIRTIIWYVEQFHDGAVKTIYLADGKPAVELSFSFEVHNNLVFAGHLDRVVKYQSDIYVMDQKTTVQTPSPSYFDQYSPNTQMSLYTFAGKIIYNVPISGVIIDVAQIAVGFSRFSRGFTFRTADQLDEWYASALYHIEQARIATARDFFPMNTASCNNYGGCPFRGICSKSPSVRDMLLSADFTRRKWDPLERR